MFKKFFIVFCLLTAALQSRASQIDQTHILTESSKNDAIFYTKRLIALPVNEARIKGMADLLNQQTHGGQLNGLFYESGIFKDAAWVAKKKDLLLGNLAKGLINARFFLLRDQPEKMICFVGAELSYFSESPNALVPFWGTDLAYQGQGFSSEALRGFVLADIMRDPHFTSLLISIHPSNEGSIHLAEKVLGAQKVREGMNYTKSQPRAFYEVMKEVLALVVETYPPIGWEY